MTPEALRARLAQRIRALAEAKGFPLGQLADRAEVSRAGFFLALSGKSAPSLDFVAKVATALGVDPVELLKPPKKTRKPRS